jgi:hypothetical protein
VRWLGAVQSQDYPGAKWGVAVRTRGITSVQFDKAFNAGKILRTHTMRPTWHFVAPQDLRWLLALTSPRVQMMNGSQYRRLELDDVVFRRAHGAITKALEGGRSLTRSELGGVLEAKRVSAKGQRLAYIAMHAELAGLICSGPIKGKQHTYALLEERLPPVPMPEREEALLMLARRYFTSHGPATAHDFAWWSGLTVTEARRAATELGEELRSETVGNKTYWQSQNARHIKIKPPLVHLLPNYDEHVVAYRYHSASLDPRAPNALDGWGNALTAHLVSLNGLIVGGWRRAIEPDQVVVKLSMPMPLRPGERKALERAAEGYGTFLGLPVTLTS